MVRRTRGRGHPHTPMHYDRGQGVPTAPPRQPRPRRQQEGFALARGAGGSCYPPSVDPAIGSHAVAFGLESRAFAENASFRSWCPDSLYPLSCNGYREFLHPCCNHTATNKGHPVSRMALLSFIPSAPRPDHRPPGLPELPALRHSAGSDPSP